MGHFQPIYNHLIRREDRERAEKQILEGPDSPGKRFLLNIQAEREKRPMREAVAQSKTAPSEVAKPPKTVASRAEIARLMTPRELPPAEDADLPFDEWAAKHPVEQDGWEAG